jgi:thymidine phosphorylase
MAMLRGEPVDERLREVTLALAAEALMLVDAAPSREEGLVRAERALASGAAGERFARMVRAQGGPADLLERPGRLPAAPEQVAVHAQQAGTIERVDARLLGLAVIGLGGGRTRPEDGVDHAVGLTAVAGIGDRCDRHTPLAIVHARDAASAEAAAATLRRAFTVGVGSARRSPVVIDRILGRELAAGG